ncbi:hypothetical protein WUBG_18208, partial [Wuchereria bancrofti]
MASNKFQNNTSLACITYLYWLDMYLCGFILPLGNTLVLFHFPLFFLHFIINHWPWLESFNIFILIKLLNSSITYPFSFLFFCFVYVSLKIFKISLKFFSLFFFALFSHFQINHKI